jgi:hypothetical protein
MDKIILKVKDIEHLFGWRDGHKDLVRSGVFPLKAVRIEFIENNYSMTVICNAPHIEFHINVKGQSFGKFEFMHRGDGRCDLVKNKTKLGHDDIESLLSVYYSAMAFMVYGSDDIELAAGDEDAPDGAAVQEIEDKAAPKKSNSAKKKHNGIIYLLRKKQGTTRSRSGRHWKISGEFSVRGHFRHYKSGKTVWIAEYIKGAGKKKDKIYKVGA